MKVKGVESGGRRILKKKKSNNRSTRTGYVHAISQGKTGSRKHTTNDKPIRIESAIDK